MRSKITGGETELLFTTTVLQKYDVQYYRCKDTGFIQTEEPYWLDEAYESTITKLDIGLVSRNIRFADQTEKILKNHFDYKGTFLDHAGGYGLFTRLMRDKGFNFYHSDKFCQNLFAEYFDINQPGSSDFFELITAFEVFEHLTDPVQEIKEILKLSDNILFSTELLSNAPDSLLDWYYLAAETGQHIAFYSLESLHYLANYFELNLYTNGRTIHLFTKSKLKFDPLPIKVAREPLLLRKARKYVRRHDQRGQVQLESLINHDWQFVKNMLNNIDSK